METKLRARMSLSELIFTKYYSNTPDSYVVNLAYYPCCHALRKAARRISFKN